MKDEDEVDEYEGEDVEDEKEEEEEDDEDEAEDEGEDDHEDEDDEEECEEEEEEEEEEDDEDEEGLGAMDREEGGCRGASQIPKFLCNKQTGNASNFSKAVFSSPGKRFAEARWPRDRGGRGVAGDITTTKIFFVL